MSSPSARRLGRGAVISRGRSKPFGWAGPSDEEQNRHADEGAVESRGHVLLGVPDVALRPQGGQAELGMERLGDPGLDDLPQTTQPENGHHRQVVQLSLIHISEPTRLLSISYAVFC